jgi:RimJ/RimL family protein N-acetyltransferase
MSTTSYAVMSSIDLRSAAAADGPMLWKWRNDPLTRRMFRTGHMIPWEEHAAWFAEVLQDPGKILLIAQDAGGPIGVVRFDSIADGRAEVSINVNPERRGQRLGQAALVAACGHAFSELGLTQLSADIRPDNAASIAIFTRIGFGFQGVHEGLNTYRLTPQQFRPSHSEPLIS